MTIKLDLDLARSVRRQVKCGRDIRILQMRILRKPKIKK